MAQRLRRISWESAILGVNNAKNGLTGAVAGLEEAKANYQRWQRQTEEAFKDVVKSLTGKTNMEASLYATDLGEVSTTIKLVRSEEDLRKAYFNFDTIFHRLIRAFSHETNEDLFKKSFSLL